MGLPSDLAPIGKPLPDSVIGSRYQLLNLLGRGGASSVFKAQDTRLYREVVLKIFQGSPGDDRLQRRLSREMMAVSRLSHPNIIRYLDFGSEENLFYIVMDYCAGGNLKQLIERAGKIQTSLALNVIFQISNGLDYLHEQGVIHRDIKPSNILFDTSGRAILSDFGIALVFSESDSLTTAEGFMGTPAYLSPEQATGQASTFSSDIYSLGVVAYEILVGQRPFEGETPVSIIFQQLQSQPPLPRSIVSDFPVELESVLLQALKKQPEERPLSAGEFAHQLQQASGYFGEDQKDLWQQVNAQIGESEPRVSGEAEVLEDDIAVRTDLFTPVTEELPGIKPVEVPRAFLSTIEGPARGQEFWLAKPETVIGRTSEVDIALNDAQASRRHSLISFENDQFQLTDLQSTNGTFLNDRQLIPGIDNLLQDNDHIRIGSTTLVFRLPWKLYQDSVSVILQESGVLTEGELIFAPAALRKQVLQQYIQEHPEDALSYEEATGRLWIEKTEQYLLLQDLFRAAVGSVLSGKDVAADLVVRFTNQIGHSLDVAVQIKGDKDNLSFFSLDTVEAFQSTRLPVPLPLIVERSGKKTSEYLDEIRTGLKDYFGSETRIALMVVPTLDIPTLAGVREIVHQKLKGAFAYDVLVLGRDDLANLAVSRDPHRRLRQLLLSQVDLSTVSPFVTTGPVPENIFFGREDALRTITENVGSTSYALIGGRRIGKSSVLFRLHKTRLPSAGYYSIFHDCSVTPSHTEFMAAPLRNWQPYPPKDAPKTFDDLTHGAGQYGRLVILLDEADKLIPAARQEGWQVFRSLRMLANSGVARFVLSGEQLLREGLKDPKSPLFNFVNEILVGRLDSRAAEELITRPMKQLEIELVNENQLVTLIFDFTSGHPNIIQRLCNRLVLLLNERKNRRITIDDVRSVIEDPAFQRDDFLSTFWESASNLERIITLLIAEDESRSTLAAVRAALVERCQLSIRAKEIDEALQRLVDLRTILKLTPGGYHFAIEAFPRVLKGTLTMQDMLDILVETYQEEGG